VFYKDICLVSLVSFHSPAAVMYMLDACVSYDCPSHLSTLEGRLNRHKSSDSKESAAN